MYVIFINIILNCNFILVNNTKNRNDLCFLIGKLSPKIVMNVKLNLRFKSIINFIMGNIFPINGECLFLE